MLKKIAALLALSLMLSACGQTGPLYLPKTATPHPTSLS